MNQKLAGRTAKLAGALACAAMLTPLAALAKDTQLNVYNWSDYIAKDTIPNFTKQTGIKVKYDNYDSDDTLQAKLLTGRSGYDIVVPTSNYAGKQIAANIFMPLDKSKLPNLKYLDPELMKLVEGADPGNKYVVPWAYGTTGLGYNVDKAKQILGPSVDPVRHLAKNFSSFVSRHSCPAGKCLLSGAHGGVDLSCGSGRDLGYRVLVDWGDIGESRLRSEALAADPVSSVHLHALDRRSRHPRPCQLLEVVRRSGGG